MKTKLLIKTLLVAVGLFVGASSAWAAELFSLDVTRTTQLNIAYQATYPLTAGDATMVGGSAEIYNAKNAESSEVISSASYINLAASGSSYLHITLDANRVLQAGDVITFTTTEAKNTIFISKTTDKGSEKTLAAGGGTNVYTYTLGGEDALIGATELYIFKSNFRYIKAITITGSGNLSDFALTSSADVTVAPSATSQITYTSSSAGAVTYTSSDPSVATVTSTGLITGVAIGFATITVSQAADASYRTGGATISVNVQNSTTHTGEWVLDTDNGSLSSKTYTTDDGSLKFTAGAAGAGSNTYNDLKNTHFKHANDITFTLPSNYPVSTVWFVGYRNGSGSTATITLKKVDGANVTTQSGTIGGSDAIPTADCVGFELESAATKSMVINISGESRGYFILNPAAQNITMTQVGTKYYATYYSAGEVTITGATAYTAELNGDKDKLILTECAGGVVGGKTGVILIGNSASATATPSFTGASKAQGDLIGVAQKQVAMANYFAGSTSAANKVFVLGVEGGAVGLYKYTGTNLGVNKAYLYNTDLAAARSIDFVFDNETTAINGISTDKVNAELKKFFENGKLVIENNGMKYNAAGQQVK
jgi:hypothetical protein